MRKELLPRLVQACTAKCQASEGRTSGICGKRAHGVASTYTSSGIPSPIKAFPSMCGALGVVGREASRWVECPAGEEDWAYMQLCRKMG